MNCPDCAGTGYRMVDIGTATIPDYVEIRCRCNPEPVEPSVDHPDEEGDPPCPRCGSRQVNFVGAPRWACRKCRFVWSPEPTEPEDWEPSGTAYEDFRPRFNDALYNGL